MDDEPRELSVTVNLCDLTGPDCVPSGQDIALEALPAGWADEYAWTFGGGSPILTTGPELPWDQVPSGWTHGVVTCTAVRAHALHPTDTLFDIEKVWTVTVFTVAWDSPGDGEAVDVSETLDWQAHLEPSALPQLVPGLSVDWEFDVEAGEVFPETPAEGSPVGDSGDVMGRHLETQILSEGTARMRVFADVTDPGPNGSGGTASATRSVVATMAPIVSRVTFWSLNPQLVSCGDSGPRGSAVTPDDFAGELLVKYCFGRLLTVDVVSGPGGVFRVNGGAPPWDTTPSGATTLGIDVEAYTAPPSSRLLRTDSFSIHVVRLEGPTQLRAGQTLRVEPEPLPWPDRYEWHIGGEGGTLVEGQTGSTLNWGVISGAPYNFSEGVVTCVAIRDANGSPRHEARTDTPVAILTSRSINVYQCGTNPDDSGSWTISSYYTPREETFLGDYITVTIGQGPATAQIRRDFADEVREEGWGLLGPNNPNYPGSHIQYETHGTERTEDDEWLIPNSAPTGFCGDPLVANESLATVLSEIPCHTRCSIPDLPARNSWPGGTACGIAVDTGGAFAPGQAGANRIDFYVGVRGRRAQSGETVPYSDPYQPFLHGPVTVNEWAP